MIDQEHDEAEEVLLDREDKLARIQVIKEQQKRLKEEYETLRNEVTPDEGEYVLITGHDGQKYRVTRVEGADTVFYLDKLQELVDPTVVEQITELKVNTEAFKQAVAAGRITPAVLVQVMSLKPKAAYPKYEPIDLE
jgi:hypothetical protein